MVFLSAFHAVFAGWVPFLLMILPVTLIGMMQEEMAWESAFVFWSDGGWFSLDQFVCLDWVEGALGAEALARWPPNTSPPSPSSVKVAWKKQRQHCINGGLFYWVYVSMFISIHFLIIVVKVIYNFIPYLTIYLQKIDI